MNREDRTIRIALDDVTFDRICWTANRMNTTPTQLAKEAVEHVLDQLIAAQEVDAVFE